MILKNLSAALILLAFLAAPALAGDGGPKPLDLPDNPIERAAIQGLAVSYRESAMWQVQKAKVLSLTPVAPTSEVLYNYDPKELYCVCVEYEARYKVEWTTTDPSPWERVVRNIAVMKTQGDAYVALKPMNLCAPFCE